MRGRGREGRRGRGGGGNRRGEERGGEGRRVEERRGGDTEGEREGDSYMKIGHIRTRSIPIKNIS